jgi:hypothetical protein
MLMIHFDHWMALAAARRCDYVDTALPVVDTEAVPGHVHATETRSVGIVRRSTGREARTARPDWGRPNEASIGARADVDVESADSRVVVHRHRGIRASQRWWRPAERRSRSQRALGRRRDAEQRVECRAGHTLPDEPTSGVQGDGHIPAARRAVSCQLTCSVGSLGASPRTTPPDRHPIPSVQINGVVEECHWPADVIRRASLEAR